MAKGRSHLNYRAEGFRPYGNEAAAKAFRELGRSSATSPHVSKPNKGTRTAKKRAALKETY